jgi:hypothetical protein
MRPRTKQDWRAAVLASPRITDATRVLLLLMADSMKPDQTVSVPRRVLAAQLGRHERRIDERVKQAIGAGFLESVAPGYRTHTAVYKCLFPAAGQAYSQGESATIRSAHKARRSTARNVFEPEPESALDGQRTISTANPADVAQTATLAATRRTA